MNILLIVTGGIAAYKACEIVRLFQKRGDEVRVVMTESACEFITPLTLATLSGNPVHVGQFSERSDVEHIALVKWAHAILVAPATYNFIGKIAHGIADDLASTVVAATPREIKVYLAPAMNTEMWKNPILQRNLEILSGLEAGLKGPKYPILAPREALLACGDQGVGALADPLEIVEAVRGEGTLS